jgi:hypothetical protein
MLRKAKRTTQKKQMMTVSKLSEWVTKLVVVVEEAMVEEAAVEAVAAREQTNAIEGEPP